jgi:hypoxanthine phosphoribosyltransferase
MLEIKKVFERSTCLYPKAAVEAALDKMAEEISQKLAKSDPIALCTMIGGVIPCGHLLSRLNFPLQLDYIHATRYRDSTTAHELEWLVEPRVSLKARTVLIIDDILDGGITLAGLVAYCKEKEAKEVFTAVLVEKQGTRLDEGLAKADFTGLEVEDHYVFGFGMDYKRYLRNAPGIYAIDPVDM